MTTRRKVLAGSIKSVGLIALQQIGPARWMWCQATQRAGQSTDDMTRNSAPQQQVYPPPDFGPPPKVLPAEAVAIKGEHSLRAHAAKAGLTSGAAVVVPLLGRDPALAELVVDQCAILVPENELKWHALRPEKDRYDFSQPDALFDFASKHGLRVRGHTLAWHNSVPGWLSQAPATMDVRAVFVDHIRTVMTRYKGRVHSWDVVNEAVLPKDGLTGGLRNSFWFQRVGPDYIDLAFRTAREADPHARLTYNDYGVEYDNAEEEERRTAILELLRGMQARNVPLDAVGVQAHIKANSPATIGKGLQRYLEAIRAMGLEIYLTELDVNEDDIASNAVEERDRIVAQTYRQFLDVALANPSVKLVLTWGISDRRTWLNGGPTHHRKQPNRPQRSLPFDSDYRPVAAFFEMRESFDVRSHSK
jgi:endo-1,4-beta-xylanase